MIAWGVNKASGKYPSNGWGGGGGADVFKISEEAL